MADEIRLNLPGVEESIGKITEKVGDLETTAGQIDAIVKSLGEHWAGRAYEKTMQTYETDYEKFLTQQVPEMVRQLNEFITGCKNAIKETDDQLSGG